MHPVILSTAFMPPVEWFRAAALSGTVLLEGCEHFQKQSYRSRCRILTAGGVETLNVPVVHGPSKNIMDVRIDYSEEWSRKIERALDAAYGSSPFYVYYRDDIIPLLCSGESSLFEYNLALIRTLTELSGLRTEYVITDEYVQDYGGGAADYRSSIHPKKTPPDELSMPHRYYQVFGERYGFTPSLSVLDLLFNEGPDSVSYLI